MNLEKQALAEFVSQAQAVHDAARSVGDQVHELVKAQACGMPTVAAAVTLGMMVARQIYEETLTFAANSMEGDERDARAIKRAARRLFDEVGEPA